VENHVWHTWKITYKEYELQEDELEEDEPGPCQFFGYFLLYYSVRIIYLFLENHPQ